ncbi:hypothetical protein KBD45_07135 [Candidatus Dojkabacteria bacterium]|nr:hypothetical protein [Candidatus Dojkabacteria bacterium]
MTIKNIVKYSLVLIFILTTFVIPTYITEKANATAPIPVNLQSNGSRFKYPVENQTLDLEGSYLFKLNKFSDRQYYYYYFIYQPSYEHSGAIKGGYFTNGEYGLGMDEAVHNNFVVGALKTIVYRYPKNGRSGWEVYDKLTNLNLKSREISIPVPVQNAVPKILELHVDQGEAKLNEKVYITLTALDKDKSDVLSAIIDIYNPKGQFTTSRLMNSYKMFDGSYDFWDSFENSNGSIAGEYGFKVTVKDGQGATAVEYGNFKFVNPVVNFVPKLVSQSANVSSVVNGYEQVDIKVKVKDEDINDSLVAKLEIFDSNGNRMEREKYLSFYKESNVIWNFDARIFTTNKYKAGNYNYSIEVTDGKGGKVTIQGSFKIKRIGATSFVYPVTSQELGKDGGYMFKLNQVEGATKYKLMIKSPENKLSLWPSYWSTGEYYFESSNGEFAFWPSQKEHNSIKQLITSNIFNYEIVGMACNQNVCGQKAVIDIVIK